MIQYVESEKVELKAKYTDTICEVISEACFTDINDSTIVLTEEEKSRIFVFDVDYFDKNIKLRDSGLDTIIMLGQQAEIEEQLVNARKILNENKEAYDTQSVIVSAY